MGWLGAVVAGALAAAAGPVAAETGCAAAGGQVAALVCGDPELAALDREATRLSRLAEGPGAEHDWLSMRDECISAGDPGLCLRDAYLERIVALRTNSAAARAADPAGISIGPLAVRCDGVAPMTVTFVNAPESLAFLAGGIGPLILGQGPSADGARYLAESAAGETVFWNKGKAATLSRPGQPDSQCTIGD